METVQSVDLNNPIISVVIPVYNVEDYLDRCLSSVVENDYKRLQIICVDDGSTDQCGEKLDRWSEKDSRIRVIHTTNIGLSEARNVGIKETTGDYIAFIDSDDFVHRSYFSTLLHGILCNSADISMCSNIRVGIGRIQDKAVPSQLKWDKLNSTQYSMVHGRGFVWGKLYKKELIQPVFEPLLIRCEDIAYNLVIMCQHPQLSVVYTKEPLYYYCNRPRSLTNTSDGDQVRVLFNHFIKLAENSIYDGNEIIEEILVSHCIRWALSYRYLSMFEPSRRETVKRICRRAGKLLHRAHSISIRGQIVYDTFLLFPIVYRMYQIIRDPTLLNWEKSQRLQKRKR